MKIYTKCFTFNAFQENTYIVYNDKLEAIIVDPGCYNRNEKEELSNFIVNKKLQVLALINTHAHIDHVLGNSFVIEKYKVDYYLHPEDIKTLQSVSNYAHLYGFEAYETSPEPTVFFHDKQTVQFGELIFEVIFGPGHSPGHVALYNVENKLLINGDILFKGSFGRVDLPGGNMNILKDTIINKLFRLPDDTIVLCGHGESTTIGNEKISNYILNF